MDCPFCDGEMEEGVLQSNYGIFYLEKPCLTGVPFRLKARNEALGNRPGPFQPPFITVSRCPRCRKILFDY